MKLQTKKVIYLLVAIASVVTIVSAVSYAYFSAMADVKEQSAVLTSGTMRVRFADDDAGINAELNFGESITKKFTIENTGTLDASLKFFWEELVNTFIEGSLTYTLSQSETEGGTYTEIVNETNIPQSSIPSKNILANNLTVPTGKTYYYKLVITLNNLEDVNQEADLNAKFNTKFSVDDSKVQSVTEKIIASSKGVKTDFSTIATTDEGVYEMEDDYGTSYYYRGAVENNYVKFGKNSSGQDMWWRIIRINGDGSYRIIYDGTQAHANGEASEDRVVSTNEPFNILRNDAKYVGWMYGPANEIEGTTTPSNSREEAQSNVVSSDIKIKVDTWYKENIVDTGYSNAVADILFCNDRSTPGQTVTNWISDTGLGYGKNATGYASMDRYIDTNKLDPIHGWFTSKENTSPILKCLQKHDAFTVSDTTKGNGDLTYPVGLITIDEVAIAGAQYYNGDDISNNLKYYLYKGAWYWTLTPNSVFTDGNAYISNVNSLGDLRNTLSNYLGSVAPVINLSREYITNLIGTGTMVDPYRTAN